jgi:uncharacterized protein with HEPN domain
MSRDEATLIDILQAARLIVQFKGEADFDSFSRDLKTQSAVLHQLLILGEAIKRLSDGFRSAHPEMPWRQAAGMRDKLIHDYDAVDLEAVWHTVNADIPRLLHLIEPLAPRP